MLDKIVEIIVLAVIALTGFGVGIFGIVEYYRLITKKHMYLNGTVTELRESYSHGANRIGGFSFTPIFEFSYNNTVYQVEHKVSAAKYGKNMGIIPTNKFKAGQTVELMVPVDCPENAVLNTRHSKRLSLYIGLLFLLIGFVFSGVVFLLIW